MTRTELLGEVKRIVPTLEGWCPPERAASFAATIIDEAVETSVCLGVYGGRDVIAMAMAHRLLGKGKCLAVDPWSATASAAGQTGEHRRWWSNQKLHDDVYASFMRAIDAAKLRQWIDVRRKRSADVEPPPNIGLLVVDGNHGPDAEGDVARWAPRVSRSGLVFCDDIAWTGGAVARAVKLLERLGFQRLRNDGGGAFFRRPTPAVLR